LNHLPGAGEGLGYLPEALTEIVELIAVLENILAQIGSIIYPGNLRDRRPLGSQIGGEGEARRGRLGLGAQEKG